MDERRSLLDSGAAGADAGEAAAGDATVFGEPASTGTVSVSTGWAVMLRTKWRRRACCF
jgi:hypothetical protein